MAVPCNGQELIDRIKALNPDKIVVIPDNGYIITHECIIPICNIESLSSTIKEFNFSFYLDLTFLIYEPGSFKAFYSNENTGNIYNEIPSSDYSPYTRNKKEVHVDLNNNLSNYPVGTFIKINFTFKITDLSKINNEFAIQTSVNYTDNNSIVNEIADFKYPKYIIVPCTGEKLIDKIRILNPDKVFNVLYNGSIITCECIIPACKKCFDDSYPTPPNISTRIHLGYYINPGLFFYIDNSVEVFYSTTNDESSYTKLDPLNYEIDSPYQNFADFLNIFIKDPNKCIPTENYDYTFIKTKFKLKIINIDALPDEFYTTTTFGLDQDQKKTSTQDVWNTEWCEINIEYPKYLIKKSNYSITALGCSLNTCKPSLLDYTTPCKYKEFTEDFTAKYSFNAINEEYENAYYVLAIKPSAGIEFPTTMEDLKKIKAYISINKLSSNLEIPNVDATIDNANLIITIPYSEIYKDITQNITSTIINIYISVTIPYMIDNCILSTNEQNFTCIKGSIDFMIGDTTPTTYKTLVSLDNFCSCINFNCPNLIGIGKNLLC